MTKLYCLAKIISKNVFKISPMRQEALQNFYSSFIRRNFLPLTSLLSLGVPFSRKRPREPRGSLSDIQFTYRHMSCKSSHSISYYMLYFYVWSSCLIFDCPAFLPFICGPFDLITSFRISRGASNFPQNSFYLSMLWFKSVIVSNNFIHLSLSLKPWSLFLQPYKHYPLTYNDFLMWIIIHK